MNKRLKKIFTILALLSVLFRVAGALWANYFSGYNIALFVDMVGQLLFLSLFFFIAKDLKENYGKGVRPIYLYVFSSLIFTSLTAAGLLSASTMIFLRLLLLIVIGVFGFYLFNTVYRLFALVIIISILLMYALYFAANQFLGDDGYKYWIYVGSIPALYPLVLLYIVHTKKNITMQDEINSIGSDME